MEKATVSISSLIQISIASVHINTPKTTESQKLTFSPVLQPNGIPSSMSLRIITTANATDDDAVLCEEVTVLDFPSDYIGHSFSFTYKAKTYKSKFVNGIRCFIA